MQKWQAIWQRQGSKHLWTIPDPQVVSLAEAWRAEGMLRILDIGCGLGRHSHLLASRGFEVFGSDHSHAAIDNCRNWLAEDGLHGEFWHGELDEIPYPDGFFDGVIAFNSIYHGNAETLKRVAQLIQDKLRPGGHCFVTLPSRDNRMYGKGERIDEHTFVSPGMFNQLFDHDGERGVPHHFASRSEIHEFFQGFQFNSLEHKELQLASSRGHGSVKWLRVPQAYFWRLVATRN